MLTCQRLETRAYGILWLADALFTGIARLIPAGEGVSAQLTWNTSEGAILHLPRGASRLNCDSDLLRNHAIKHAYNWYEFANARLHRRIPSGSLYLITGTDKTDSWMVGTFSGALRGSQVSLHVNSGRVLEGGSSFNYSWANASAPAYRTGPRAINYIPVNQTDMDAVNQDDALFRGDAPDNQNQCVFARGHRIMLNCNTTSWGKMQWDTEVLPIMDADPGHVSAMATDIPFAGSSRSTLVSDPSGKVGNPSSHHRVGTSDNSMQSKTILAVQDHEVVLEHIPEYLEVRVNDGILCIA